MNLIPSVRVYCLYILCESRVCLHRDVSVRIRTTENSIENFVGNSKFEAAQFQQKEKQS